MSTFPGLTAVIAGVIDKHYPGDPALPDAIARAVGKHITANAALIRMDQVLRMEGYRIIGDILIAAIRAALGEENTDG